MGTCPPAVPTRRPGEELGTTEWIEVTQDRVDRFAEATGDHQWIHVDTERAASGPFGGTIAHGYLTLALIPFFNQQLVRIEVGRARLNYGLNRVRFPAPVRVGARIRCRASLLAVESVPAGRQLVTSFVLELEESDKPACVAEAVVLLLT